MEHNDFEVTSITNIRDSPWFRIHHNRIYMQACNKQTAGIRIPAVICGPRRQGTARQSGTSYYFGA